MLFLIFVNLLLCSVSSAETVYTAIGSKGNQTLELYLRGKFAKSTLWASKHAGPDVLTSNPPQFEARFNLGVKRKYLVGASEVLETEGLMLGEESKGVFTGDIGKAVLASGKEIFFEKGLAWTSEDFPDKEKLETAGCDIKIFPTAVPTRPDGTAKKHDLLRRTLLPPPDEAEGIPREVRVVFVSDTIRAKQKGTPEALRKSSEAIAAQVAFNYALWTNDAYKITVKAVDFVYLDSPGPWEGTTFSSSLIVAFRRWAEVQPWKTPDVLAHLLTGTDMDGNVIGIAYMGMVCSTFAQVGVTQTTYTLEAINAKIATHEIGHNIGLPHVTTVSTPITEEQAEDCASSPTEVMQPFISSGLSWSMCTKKRFTVFNEGYPSFCTGEECEVEKGVRGTCMIPKGGTQPTPFPSNPTRPPTKTDAPTSKPTSPSSAPTFSRSPTSPSQKPSGTQRPTKKPTSYRERRVRNCVSKCYRRFGVIPPSSPTTASPSDSPTPAFEYEY